MSVVYCSDIKKYPGKIKQIRAVTFMTENRYLISVWPVNNYNTCSLWEVMGMVICTFHFFEALNDVFRSNFFRAPFLQHIKDTDNKWDLAAQIL